MYFACPICGNQFAGPKVKSHNIGAIPFKVTVVVEDTSVDEGCQRCGTKFTAVFRGDSKALQEGYSLVDYRNICPSLKVTNLINDFLNKDPQ
jgi:C4-type Zn-finger protein